MSEDDKVFHRLDPGDLRRLSGAADLRAFCREILRDVAAHVRRSAVLETAAGSGVVTRALAPMLARDASYVVTDLNQPMLDYAAARQGSRSRGSYGSRRMLWRCRSRMRPSISSAASSARCSFPTGCGLPRGAARAEARRTLPVQRLGPHRGERIRRRRDGGARRALSRRSAALHGAHAARLSRHGADPRSWSRRASPMSRSRPARRQPRALGP